MLEAWEKPQMEKAMLEPFLLTILKPFGCLNHDLLIAKLSAYGFSMNALNFIRSYLKERRQRAKVGSSFSNWLEIKFGDPQRSILGPLLFNIHLS